jgi:hypothetical protein
VTAGARTELGRNRELVSRSRILLLRRVLRWSLVVAGVLSLGPRTSSDPAFLASVGKPVAGSQRSLPPYSKRFALLIAAGTFQRPGIKTLKGPNNDIDLMSHVLTDRGFLPSQNVITLFSGSSDLKKLPTVSNIRGALNNDLQDKVAGGLVIVEYSGHGFAKNGVPYLLTWDSVLGSQESLDDQALRVSKLMGMLQTVHASQIVLLVDACQDDPDASHSLNDNLMTLEFQQAFSTELRGDLKASLVFFATRPPRRAYANSHDQGYFTAAAVDVLNAAATAGGSTSVSLNEFISTVTKNVSTDTGQRQIPKAEYKGYDLAAVKITSIPTPSSSHDGSWHKIKFRYTGTENTCAPLPSNAKLLVTTATAIETVDGPLDCEMQYRLARASDRDTVSLSLINASPIVVDSEKRAYNPADEAWTIDVHPGGMPLRISTFEGNDADGTHGKYASFRNLNDRAWALAGLLAVNSETAYTRELSVVVTGVPLPDSLDHQLEYLRKTNSLELFTSTTRVSESGTPLILLRALMLSKADPGYRQISVEIPISDSNYSKIVQVENALMLAALLESAKMAGYQQAQTILSNQLQLGLQQIDDTASGLKELQEIAPGGL